MADCDCAGVQRIGSNATASAASQNVDDVNRQRTSTALLRTLPLLTRGTAAGGVNSPNTPQPGSAGLTVNSTSVAKDILDDNNSE